MAVYKKNHGMLAFWQMESMSMKQLMNTVTLKMHNRALDDNYEKLVKENQIILFVSDP